MIKRSVLYVATLLLSALAFLGCQPETAGQDGLQSPAQLPALPSAAVHADDTPSAAPASAGGQPIEPTDVPQDALPEPMDGLATDSKLQVQMAKGDLARRLEIQVEKISTLSVEAVMWPDAGLGCPLPGIVYAQVLTPGYLIWLEFNGQEFEYHSDEGSQIIQCRAARNLEGLPVIPIKPGDIDDGVPWMPVE